MADVPESTGKASPLATPLLLLTLDASKDKGFKGDDVAGKYDVLLLGTNDGVPDPDTLELLLLGVDSESPPGGGNDFGDLDRNWTALFPAFKLEPTPPAC